MTVYLMSIYGIYGKYGKNSFWKVDLQLIGAPRPMCGRLVDDTPSLHPLIAVYSLLYSPTATGGMFSKATVNPMEAVITKATDENLTSENWELILNVCDKVNADHENGAKNAILALQKRLAHRNANVQLYSLSVRYLHRFADYRWQKRFPRIADLRYSAR